MTDTDIYEAETNLPLGTVWLLPCARHPGLQHRHESIRDPDAPAQYDFRVWHCVDPSPDKTRLLDVDA